MITVHVGGLIACIVVNFITGLGVGYARGRIKLNDERREWVEYLRELRRDLVVIEEALVKRGGAGG